MPDDTHNPFPDAFPGEAIGRPHRRVDALGKVTGRVRFAADLAVPGMLHGRVLTSDRPHARILEVDTDAAREAPGVHAVLTAADLRHAREFGVVILNQPVLACDRVRQFGDGIALVAADTAEDAEIALERIRIQYEDLPGVFDPEKAMLPGAPMIHENAVPEHDPDGRSFQNLCAHHRVRKGDAADPFQGARVVLERTYRTPHIEHAYLEPEAVLAEPAEDGGIRVTGSIQNLFSTRRSLAAVLGLDLARVSVEHAAIGGSFGGKDEVMTQMACRAALLAVATGRPVKMVNSRERSMAESYKRHPYVLHYRLGADAEGRLLAIEARIIADAGAYASMSPFVTWRSAVQATGPYEYPNVAVDVYAVYTNNPYTGAMRGFGSPQVNFAIESLMDELAGELGIDPLELRVRNSFTRGSVTATGQVLDHEVSLREVLEKAAGASRWCEKRRAIEEANRSRSDGRKAGIGLACCYRGVSLGAEGVDAAGAIVSIQTDGSVLVSAGFTDVGQGASSALSLIASEVLGIGLERVKFWNVHTGRVPDSGPSVASRATLIGGQAVKRAAEAVRSTLFLTAGEELGASPDALVASGGSIRVNGTGPERRGISFEGAVRLTFERGRPLVACGWHPGPKTSWDHETGRGEAYFTFVYSAEIAEVEVDIETGKVEVLRVTAAHDLGRAISPAMVRSQIGGGVAMGVGYALLEDFAVEGGIPAFRNFDTYLLPTALDVPEITALLIENPDAAGPFGAKSVGEPAVEVVAPAVTNALAHATGRFVRELPADLEAVLLGRRLRPGPVVASPAHGDRQPAVEPR